MKGSLQYLWGMINALQIVFHFPAFALSFPANSKMFYSTLITITKFDVIPEDWVEYCKFWKYFDYASSKGRRLEDEFEDWED